MILARDSRAARNSHAAACRISVGLTLPGVHSHSNQALKGPLGALKKALQENARFNMQTSGTVHAGVESPFAWVRLVVAVLLGTVGSVGMWSVPVVLPVVQADFGVARADASLPFTLGMVGFAVGGVAMGRLSDRFGIVAPVVCGISALGVGYVAAAFAPNIIVFAAVHTLIGFGASATFGPLIADTSQWFTLRRGIAVALVSSGNYVGGAFWPPILHHFIAAEGWRSTHFGVGVFCALAMLPPLLALRRRAPMQEVAATGGVAEAASLGLSPAALQVVLCLAGLSCCVAMSMPQVHIVAYCGDLGYGVARGAEMLSVMLGFGIFSRIGSGFIADRIGGVPTLLLSSVLQGVALFLYLFFDGLASLYIISALFGLFQGGIVPMYAIIVREYFSPQEAGTRLGIVLMATLFGMALGGWMSGVIFDLTGSYRAAFANGLLWNLVNVSIALWLLMRPGRRVAPV
jgi:MFS family permease